MKNRIRILQKRGAALLLCMLLLVVTGCSANSTEYSKSSGGASLKDEITVKEQQRFDKWCKEQFVDTMENSGTLSLHYTLDNPKAYGIEEDKEDIAFEELSIEKMEEDNNENKECYKELMDFKYEALTDEQRLTYDVLVYYLKLALCGVGFELYSTVLSPDLGVPANMPVELAEYPLNKEEDVDTYLILLTKVPEYFEQLAEYERQVSAAGLFISDETLSHSLKQMKEFIAEPKKNYLITTFEERLNSIEGLSADKKKEFLTTNESYVNEYVIAGYRKLIEDMEVLKGTGKNEGGLCHFKKGKEYYSYLAKYYTCSDMEVNDIWDILERRLDTLMTRLSSLMTKNEDVFDEYDELEYSMSKPKDILEYLKKKMEKYYPECPDVNYQVKRVDKSLAESLSPAFYMVPQIDNKNQNTIYINDKSSSFSMKDLFNTLAHEGYPGHLYQTNYYNSTNPNPIRQILNFGGYTEGWATYVELSSYELYDYGKSDEEITDLCQVDSELSLAISSIADIGVNYKGWDKEKLKSFLDEYGMGDVETVNELYTLVVEDPANYLQYYVSYLEFWNLRCMAKESLKDKFTSKDFHKVILDCGPAPFDVLRKQVEEYITSKGKE